MVEHYTFTDRDGEVIKCLAEKDLCMTAVAKAQHYHVNTIEYHVRRITEKTGLNPTKFYDMVELLRRIEKQGGGGGNENRKRENR